MEAVSYTAAREKLASLMDHVCNDHEPVIVTRNRDQAVVLVSLEDFKAMEETAYLLKSPENAKRIIDAIAQLGSGKGTERSLSE
jgi:antitoxin YefM